MNASVYSQKELSEIHKEETEILRIFDQLCSENGLRYSVLGGTMLGTIRHHGFIPWDNDIDVLIPRPDFFRFEALFYSYFGTNFRIDSQKTVKNYMYWWDQIRCSAFRNDVWVDVFPADFTNDLDAALSDGRKRRYWLGVFERKIHSFGFELSEGRYNKGFKTVISKIIPMPIVKRHVNATNSELIDGEFLVDFNNAYGFEKAVFNGALFCKPLYLPFENIQVECYPDFDAILQKQFGDYMKLPPIEKRFSFHSTTNVAK